LRAYTLAVRPCKKNPNPKARFDVFKIGNLAFDKERWVYKPYLLVVFSVVKRC